MTPEKAHAATEDFAVRNLLCLASLIVGEFDAAALWAFAVGSRPAEQANPLAFLRPLPPRKPKRRGPQPRPAPPPADSVTQPPARPAESRSARRLLKVLLRKPKSEADVRIAVAAAEIGERTLQAAVAALGVETSGGQWRLPGR